MKPELGKTYLITTDNWFYAPDGGQYRAAFGTVTAILSDSKTLGIATNSRSTNWYVQIGTLLIAGCQIHYAIRSDNCWLGNTTDTTVVEGVAKEASVPSRIFNADEPQISEGEA